MPLPPGLVVQKTQCATRIYRPDSVLDLDKLESEVRGLGDAFNRFRACHAHRTEMVCCRGFWNRHAARCTVAQIAQRTNSVYTIDERGDVKHWPQPVERVAVDWGPKGRRRRRAGGETEAGPETRMEDADPAA